MTRAVAVDLDGALGDTRPLWDAFLADAARRFGSIRSTCTSAGHDEDTMKQEEKVASVEELVGEFGRATVTVVVFSTQATRFAIVTIFIQSTARWRWPTATWRCATDSRRAAQFAPEALRANFIGTKCHWHVSLANEISSRFHPRTSSANTLAGNGPLK